MLRALAAALLLAACGHAVPAASPSGSGGTGPGGGATASGGGPSGTGSTGGSGAVAATTSGGATAGSTTGGGSGSGGAVGTTGGGTAGVASSGGATGGASGTGGGGSAGSTSSGSTGGGSTSGAPTSGSTGGASASSSTGGGSGGSASTGSGGGSTSGGTFPASACAPQSSDPTAHARADEATGRFLVHYWSQALDYLSDSWGGSASATATGYWTFAQALDAVLDADAREGGLDDTVRTFYDAAGSHVTSYSNGFASNYYDDENWMTLALIRAYDETGDGSYLSQAEQIYGSIEAAWDTSCCGAAPGGIWWDTAHTQKATASNAGPVISGVRLAARTGNGAYLAFAEQVYAYWRANFVNAQGQVADHVNAGTGKVLWWKFTYDEGLMIGAAAELHRATGGAAYLADARAFAAWMIGSETASSGDGPVLDDGTTASCTGDCAQFKGIGYRYLDLLGSFDPTISGTAVLPSSPAAVWDFARGPGDVFATDWAGPPVTSAPEPAVTSALMALNLGAARAGQYPGATLPANHVQAEAGVLNGVGLEATHAGFEGFGYVAGWGGQGQSVAMDWTVPFAGNWRLTFQYAAGAGTAVRALTLNGQLSTSSLTFPATGSWGNWGFVHHDVALAKGPLKIKVGYPAGSSGYLNLDAVIVKPVPACSALPAFPAIAAPFDQADCCGAPLPQLAWTAASGASSYNVVVDGSVACATTATSCDPGPLAPGIHTWYVEAVNGCGGNFSPPSRLVVSEVPAAVASPSPADGATLSGTTLSWSPSAPGSQFELLLDGQPVCAGLSVASCTLAAAPASGSHQWQVVASTGCGQLPGPVWVFTAP